MPTLDLTAFALLLARVAKPQPQEEAADSAAPAAAPASEEVMPPAPSDQVLADGPAEAPALDGAGAGPGTAPLDAPPDGAISGAPDAADQAWTVALERLLSEHIVDCPLIDVVSQAAAADDDDDDDYVDDVLHEVVPPWAAPDAAYEQLRTKRAELRGVFVVSADAGLGGEEDAARVPTPTISAATAQTLAAQLGSLAEEILTVDKAMAYFSRVQAQTIVDREPDEGAAAIDFDEFITWLWLCLRERFGHRIEGFESRVAGWMGSLPQLAPPPPPAVEEPPPEPKSPSGKKSKK